MKIKILKVIIAVVLLLGTIAACKQEEYFIDTGVAKAKFDGNVLQFLKSKPIFFDSLTRVIEIAGMNDYLSNKEVTFFAPTSSTIYKSIKSLNNYLYRNGRDTVSKLEQIKPEAWKALLSLYIFEKKNKLKDYPQMDTLNMAAFPGQGYLSLNGRTMNIGVNFGDAVSIKDQIVVSSIKYAGYRQLYISYIPNFTAPREQLRHAPVATSDIEPTNGIIHVLVQDANYGGTWRSKHTFGFEADVFINTVESFGIVPATP